jgi:hypothetical protein
LNRRDDLNEFYRILSELRDRLGGYRLLDRSDSKSGWPERGVYFSSKTASFERTASRFALSGLGAMLLQPVLGRNFGTVCLSIAARRAGVSGRR